MKFILLTSIPTTLLSFAAAAAPTTPQNPSANAIAYLRLLTTQNTHYFPSPDQQLGPSSGGSTTIPIMIGQSLDLSADPPFAQEVELQRVTPGKDLQGVEVKEGDERVVCKATVGFSSKGVEVGVKDTVTVSGGRGARITGVFCEVR